LLEVVVRVDQAEGEGSILHEASAILCLLDNSSGSNHDSEDKAKLADHMSAPIKAALEELLRARRLQAAAPPLRGVDRRLAPVPFGVASLDALLEGGLPRGELSELHGPASSGRTGLALALAARTTRAGALVAWVDPADRLDPASAAAAGVVLSRLLWVRGEGRAPRGLPQAVAALGTLAGSGIFELLVFDLAGAPPGELRRLPHTTWLRLERMVEDSPQVVLLLADAHVAHGPGGVSLGLAPAAQRWLGRPGPGRLLGGLQARARAGRLAAAGASVELHAFG
jgi:hypothetical protein